MTNPDEKQNHDDLSRWINELSDERVADLFRAIKERTEQTGNADAALCRAMAMSLAASDLIDVFAFCVPPEALETEIATLVHHIRDGHGILRDRWDIKLGKRKPRGEFPLEMVCPFCGARHAIAVIADGQDRSPEAGDASLCIQCGELTVFAFDQPGKLRKPTVEELNSMAEDEAIKRMKRAWKTAKELEEPTTPNPNTPWRL